jgi:hypothetical protein
VVIVGICYKAYLGEPGQSTAEPANLANASITSYFLVAAALPFYLRRRAQLTPAAIALAIAAALAMLLAMAGTLYPIPAAPYNVLPYIYLAYLLAGLAVRPGGFLTF